MAGDSWTEEGASVDDASSETAQDEQTRRQRADRRLLPSEGDREVQVGDTIDYVDAFRSEDVLSVRITRPTTALDQGLIAERTALAQVLLGGVVTGDN